MSTGFTMVVTAKVKLSNQSKSSDIPSFRVYGGDWFRGLAKRTGFVHDGHFRCVRLLGEGLDEKQKDKPVVLALFE